MMKLIFFGSEGSLGSKICPRLVERDYEVLKVDLTGDCDVRLNANEEHDVAKFFDDLCNEKELYTGLVNFVGLIHSKPLYNPMAQEKYLSFDEWQAVLETNLDTAFIIAKHYHRYCNHKRIKCNLINVSSVAAAGNPGQIAYSSAKAAVETLTISLAKELGPSGHRFNVLSPGFIDVESTKSNLSESRLSQIISNTPVRRLGDIGSLANAIVVLLESDFITGHIMKVDGGYKL
ncbi:SDR family oxidoreductase [Amylibacter sp.]|jgi:3-oxoacyl-[acyl-carrier protein] reductase|nr:SDR family oxidoreductase [Amylibacter sp.]